jgi:hypothetical protein
MKLRLFWDVRSSITALMMEAVCTSETSVDIQLITWQYIPQDSELQKKKLTISQRGGGVKSSNFGLLVVTLCSFVVG